MKLEFYIHNQLIYSCMGSRYISKKEQKFTWGEQHFCVIWGVWKFYLWVQNLKILTFSRLYNALIGQKQGKNPSRTLSFDVSRSEKRLVVTIKKREKKK